MSVTGNSDKAHGEISNNALRDQSRPLSLYASELTGELSGALKMHKPPHLVSSIIGSLGQVAVRLSEEHKHLLFDELSEIINEYGNRIAVDIIKDYYLSNLRSRYGSVPLTTVAAIHSLDAARLIITNEELAVKCDLHGWSSAHEAVSDYFGFLSYVKDHTKIANLTNQAGFSVLKAAERKEASNLLRTI